MKKYVTVIVVTILAIGFFTLLLPFVAGTNDKSNETMEQAVLCLLQDEIINAVRDYYGEFRSYMNPEILRLQKAPGYPNSFKAVIQVTTFLGPHNPPYGLETLTFNIQSNKIKLIDFRHQ